MLGFSLLGNIKMLKLTDWMALVSNGPNLQVWIRSED